MIVGLTGGIGSGKTTVLNFFKAFQNISVYIADEEAKNLMNSSPLLKSQLINAFGKELFVDNTLQRAFLSNLVFKDPKKLQILNEIVHPQVAKHFSEFVALNAHKAYILYENAILFETQNNQFCDCILTVSAPLEDRISRIIHRDQRTRRAVLDRMQHQFPEEKKRLQSNYLIQNTSLPALKEEVYRIHNILTL